MNTKQLYKEQRLAISLMERTKSHMVSTIDSLDVLSSMGFISADMSKTKRMLEDAAIQIELEQYKIWDQV